MRSKDKNDERDKRFSKKFDNSPRDLEAITPNERNLYKVFNVTREWYTFGCMAALRTLMQRPSSMSITTTPLTPEIDPVNQTVHEKWDSIDLFLQAIGNSLSNMVEHGVIPDEILNFLEYLTRAGSPIPESFLLPIEKKMLRF
jgi:hypothetical protein